MNEDEFVRVKATYDSENQALILAIEAKKKVAVIELQGFTKTLEQFEASMPLNFKKRLFGEDTIIPPEMEIEMKVMNEAQFRWGTEIAIASGQTQTIVIPAKTSSNEPNVLTLVYQHPKLFGLLKGKYSIYVRLGGQ